MTPTLPRTTAERIFCQSSGRVVKRPSQAPERVPLTDEERATLAATASYQGSAEHKTERWWGGLGKAKQLRGGGIGRPGRQRTTPCPLTSTTDRERANRWLSEAILAGQYLFVEGDQRFPKKVWYRQIQEGTPGREKEDQIWMGWCFNTAAGEYKGWPINKAERDAVFG